MEHLVERGFTPGTISNHITHIRTYYKLAALSTAPLYHYRVGLALRAISISIRHAPSSKLMVTPQILRRALTELKDLPNFLPVRLAILIMFMGFLRQSSVAPNTKALFDPTRHLTRGDVWQSPKGLHVRLKWSKTLQRSADATVLLLPPTTGQELCPVQAYQDMLRDMPTTSPAQPLLMYHDSNPLTVRYIAARWTEALQAAALPPGVYSLHSLRKGGASFTYNQPDTKLNDVMHQGTWRSDAVRAYIKPQDLQYNTVHKALQTL